MVNDVSSVQASPLALKIFLDALAELIAEAILEEARQGRPLNSENGSEASLPGEDPSC